MNWNRECWAGLNVVFDLAGVVVIVVWHWCGVTGVALMPGAAPPR